MIKHDSKYLVPLLLHQVRVYDPSTPQRRPVLEADFGEYPLTALSLPASQDAVVVGNTHGELAILDLRKGKHSSRWKLRLFFFLSGRLVFELKLHLLRVFFLSGSVFVPSIKAVSGQPFSLYVQCNIIELLSVLFCLTPFTSPSACRACSWVF